MTETIAPLTAITDTIAYLDVLGVDVEPAVRLRARRLAVKAVDLSAVNAFYHNEITEAMITYFEGGIVTGPRNRFRVATTEAFYDAFYAGWQAGGGGTPDQKGLDWLVARVNQEYGYIDMLFLQIKEMRKEQDQDFLAWVSDRADGYTRTLKEIYNTGYAMSSRDIMVTFAGDDGKKSCPDCKKYKGQRHRLSWFVRRNAVPPFGSGLACHKGGQCLHYLQDDSGKQVTA